MTGRAAVISAALVVTLGLAGGAAWWAETRTASPLTSSVPPAPLIAPASAGESIARYGVGVTARYAEGFAAVFRGAGTVTGVATSVGATLDSGDPVLAVDDVVAVAMVAEAPLWRDLASGDEGDDVARLQIFLHELGFYAGDADGTFGPATGRAVEAFNGDHEREALGGTFAASSVVWVGHAPLEVASIAATVGSDIGLDPAVVAGPRRATAIVVAEPTGGIPSRGAYVLQVGDVSAPYVPGSGEVSEPTAVSSMTALLGTTGEGAGQVLSAFPEAVLRVPASAVVIDASGASCVFVGVGRPPVPVTVLGGTLSSAELNPDAPVSEVLVNPLQVLEEPTCG